MNGFQGSRSLNRVSFCHCWHCVSGLTLYGHLNYISNFNPSKIDWSKRVSSQNRACCEECFLKDNKHNSLHLARKHAQIFVLGRYLFLKAHSSPRATLSEQMMSANKYQNICSLNGGYCLFIQCAPALFLIEGGEWG